LRDSKKVEFTAIIQQEGNFTFISLPLLPRDVWGPKPRYKVTGTINSFPVRGTLGALNQDYFLRLSKTWLNNSGMKPGDQVSVCLVAEEI